MNVNVIPYLLKCTQKTVKRFDIQSREMDINIKNTQQGYIKATKVGRCTITETAYINNEGFCNI